LPVASCHYLLLASCVLHIGINQAYWRLEIQIVIADVQFAVAVAGHQPGHGWGGGGGLGAAGGWARLYVGHMWGGVVASCGA
jgi:hypothetical protein